MPDEKKLAVLEARGLELRETCGSCSHYRGTVGGFHGAWGYCEDAKVVRHEKHTDGVRASVRIDCWCPRYTPNPLLVSDAARSGFTRFQEKRP